MQRLWPLRASVPREGLGSDRQDQCKGMASHCFGRGQLHGMHLLRRGLSRRRLHYFPRGPEGQIMSDGMRFGTGNEAVIDAALAAGCQLFAGYPVTPATEILEAAASKFPLHGRVMIPTEGEVAAINLVGGAA